jgi:hypothetical protein
MKNITVHSSMSYLRSATLVCIAVYILASCARLLIPADSTATNEAIFDHLARTVGEKYTFFEFKNIDWSAVQQRYRPRALQAKNDQELFAVLASMLIELQDDHTNLIAPFNVSRSSPFFSVRTNFDSDILAQNYLKNQEWVTGALRNTIIERSGQKVGYIRYASFSIAIDSLSIHTVFRRFRAENVVGIIIDIRSNGGGAVANALRLASYIVQGESQVFVEMQKSGPGARDFTTPTPVIVKPPKDVPVWQDKPVAVLIDRDSYSASSMFAAMMKSPECRHVRLVGDHTGGGAGLPINFELPNGWTFRFSGTKLLIPAGRVTKEQAIAVAPTANHEIDWSLGYNFEAGVPVDIRVLLDVTDRTKDTIIERAIRWITTGA